MPLPSVPLEKLGFLTIGSFSPDDPRAGHETTLEVIELGERLGFDSAWLRHRHLQYGISSPVAVMAAASTFSGTPRASSSSPTGCSRTPRGWPSASGTAPRASVPPAGPASRGSRC